MGAVDLAGSHGVPDQKQRQRAAAFADCGEDYFGDLEERLLAQRPALVEQHRELLERFAQQIDALGYTP